MTQFDLDEAKCMFCGLCVEPCPTGAIQHTREFEGSVIDLRNLTFRWVDPAKPAPLYKVPKGTQAYMRKPLGSLVRTKIKAWDAPGPSWLPPPKDGAVVVVKKKAGGVDAASLELAKRAIGVDRKKLAVILEEAQAGTDCGECTYPTCRGLLRGHGQRERRAHEPLQPGRRRDPRHHRPDREELEGGLGRRGRRTGRCRRSGRRRTTEAVAREARRRFVQALASLAPFFTTGLVILVELVTLRRPRTDAQPRDRGTFG